ncbi:BQ2448_7604 [Microbotryum intermedium]|uniref:BQ2448_7604 protein n=1 Tax=Microbotryum intermedium TaxID=269621 RepID=A0A238FN31_9BASI|nr:BQ2448_7604 [Microbotryum intermedium]
MEADNLRNAARLSLQRRKPDIADAEVAPSLTPSAPAPLLPETSLANNDHEWTALIQDLVRSGVEPQYLSTLGCSQLVVDIAAILSGSRPESRLSDLPPFIPPTSLNGYSITSTPAFDLSQAESIHKDKLLSRRAALALRNQARARSFEHELDSLLFAPADSSSAEGAARTSSPLRNGGMEDALSSQEDPTLTHCHARPLDDLAVSRSSTTALGSSMPSGMQTPAPAQECFVSAASTALVIDLSDSEGDSVPTVHPTQRVFVRSIPSVDHELASPFLAQANQVEGLVRAEQLAQQEVALLRTKLELAQLQRRKQGARS